MEGDRPVGAVVKNELSEEDVKIVADLFQRLQPEQIYAAGDLSDPHGTHRTCLLAIMLAIERVKQEPWFQECQVCHLFYLYLLQM